jgi:NodT family efflux transporter outer membrane factor (OMF) lipoprotein
MTMALGRSKAHIVAACLFAITIAGCTVGPEYKRPESKAPDHFGEVAATKTVDVARWWTTFKDPTLNSLIDRAVAANLDLRLATARIRESRAQRGVVGADLWPDVNLGGSYNHSRGSENAFSFDSGSLGNGNGNGGGGNGGGGTGNPGVGNFAAPGQEQDLYQVGFDANWELDVFGRVRRSIEAAEADTAAAIEDRRDTLVTLLAEVARNYVELRSFQRRLVIAKDNLKSQQDTLDLTRAKFRAQIISELDVTRSEAQVASTASQIPSLESQRNQAAHRLAVLVGQQPRALLDKLLARADASVIPAGPPEVPPGIPSEVLRRRPDVRRSERELAAATARIGVATADLFPRFSLTGSLGLQSQTFNDLGEYGSRFYSIGPSVSWPFFDAGRIRSNINVKTAQQEQALVRYEQSVLTALEDVENALVSYGKEQQKREQLQRAANANRRSVEMARQLYERGLTGFLDVLEAQRNLFISEDALVQSDATVSSNLVALYKALGGGWDPANGETAATRPATAPTTQP